MPGVLDPYRPFSLCDSILALRSPCTSETFAYLRLDLSSIGSRDRHVPSKPSLIRTSETFVPRRIFTSSLNRPPTAPARPRLPVRSPVHDDQDLRRTYVSRSTFSVLSASRTTSSLLPLHRPRSSRGVHFPVSSLAHRGGSSRSTF